MESPPLPPNNQPGSGLWFYLNFTVAALRVIAPLALWYGFLFLPINDYGNPGWHMLITLLHPFLWFFGLIIVAAELLFWGSYFSLAMRWWGIALVGSGIATAILFSVNIFPNLSVGPYFPSMICLWASHLLVVLWALIGVVCRAMGLDSEGLQIPQRTHNLSDVMSN